MSKPIQGVDRVILASDNFKGVLWALLSTCMIAIVGAMAKVAVTEYHVLQILFFRQIAVLLSSLPSISSNFPQALKTKHPGIHSLRLTGAFIALSCGIWAIAVLPLATAVTLGFAEVFFVCLIALYFLGEKVGMHRIFAVVVGFVGVVIVIRPGIDGVLNIHAFIPVLGAIGAAVAMTSVRKLSQTESTATLLAYQSIFVGVLSGIPMFWFWVTPNLADTLFLLSMGVLSAASNWIGVKALRLGEASVIGNTRYSGLVFAAILGYFIFNEVPDSYTVAGALVIIGSSVYILHRETIARK